MGTCGLNPDKTTKIEKWLHGPNFLRHLDDDWKMSREDERSLSEDDPEVREPVHAVTAQNDVGKTVPNPYSTWSRLRRVIPWVVRFYENVNTYEQ